MNELLDDSLGRVVRDFLDVDAAVLAGHQHRFFGGAIENDAQVQLALDAEPLLNEDALDNLAFRAGLVGHQPHPDHVGRRLPGSVRSFHDLDSAALATAASVNLGLDDHRSTTEPGGGGTSPPPG